VFFFFAPKRPTRVKEVGNNGQKAPDACGASSEVDVLKAVTAVSSLVFALKLRRFGVYFPK
jgi:hypothetical protein